MFQTVGEERSVELICAGSEWRKGLRTGEVSVHLGQHSPPSYYKESSWLSRLQAKPTVNVRTVHVYACHCAQIYTVSQKQYTWLLIITLANVVRFSKFSSLKVRDSWENSLCNYYTVFHLTLTMLLHYLAKFKNFIQRLNFYSYHHN